MDAEERVLRTLAHEEPDKVPYFESTFTNDTIMDHYGVKSRHLGSLFKLLKILPFRHKVMNFVLTRKNLVKKALLNLGKFYRNAGIDMIPSVTALFPRKIVKDGFIDEFGRHMHFEYYQDGTEIIGYVGGYFKSFDDYESWEQPDPGWSARMGGYRAGTDMQRELEGKVFVFPSTTGMMEVTWEGFGMEVFSRIMGKRKQARKVFDDRGKFTVEVVKKLADEGAKLILIFDDYGFKNGLFMSPRNYRTLVLPWLKEACKVAHARGCKIMLHSDGDLSEILDDLVNDCRVDALNPIEPTVANAEYDIFKIHEKYGDKLTLVGNVSPMLLATGTIGEIEGYTRKLIEKLAPGGGYILASGHSINPAVSLTLWQVMVKIRDTFGTYPLAP
ncbi:MAG: uroporphyrinogen decarboxylase family protein [Promethearchaeota archaeon]